MKLVKKKIRIVIFNLRQLIGDGFIFVQEQEVEIREGKFLLQFLVLKVNGFVFKLIRLIYKQN